MDQAKLHFFGAAGSVTGSCMLLEAPQAQVLIDCGMFQGSKTLKQLNYQKFPFDPAKLTALLLTHAHIDHSGLIPKLTRAGYRGPIYATPGTVDLCGPMLADAGGIQEMDVQQLNRRNARQGIAPVEPIYTKADARLAIKQFKETPFKTWTDVAPGVRARWWNAGHILGSASIEVEVTQAGGVECLLFSGDIGAGGSAFNPDPEAPSGFDHVVMESTYGHTSRRPLDPNVRRQALADEVIAAHAAGGPLLIPAFAVERSQELIVDLLELMESSKIPPTQIFLDSPLAVEVTDAFLRFGGDGGGINRFAGLRESGQLHFTESADESRNIERVRGWHIIISASGMCDAGRVRHHLKRLLWKPQATVMLVGYQAVGTLGRILRDGEKHVRMQGEPIQVNARIRTLDVYSGHADVEGLLAWAKAREPIKGNIFLTHGEDDSRGGIRDRLVTDKVASGQVLMPLLDANYDLTPDAVATGGEVAAPRLAPAAPGKQDWHNARAKLLGGLDARLKAAKSDAEREQILARLHGALS